MRTTMRPVLYLRFTGSAPTTLFVGTPDLNEVSIWAGLSGATIPPRKDCATTSQMVSTVKCAINPTNYPSVVDHVQR
jgi:hypothetical protein